MRIRLYLKPDMEEPLKDIYGCTQVLCPGESWDRPLPLNKEVPMCNDLETDTAIDKGISDLPLVWQELPDHPLPSNWLGEGVIGY